MLSPLVIIMNRMKTAQEANMQDILRWVAQPRTLRPQWTRNEINSLATRILWIQALFRASLISPQEDEMRLKQT